MAEDGKRNFNPSKKMYKNPPKLARDEKGKVVIRKDKPAAAEPTGDGMEPDAIPVHVRQSDERRGMQARHETEHAMHDTKGGDKTEMHKRHQHEMKSMHARHAKELAGANGDAKPHAEKNTASEGEKKTPKEEPAKKPAADKKE